MKNSAVALTGTTNCGGPNILALSCLTLLINTSKNKLTVYRVIKVCFYFVPTYKVQKERFLKLKYFADVPVINDGVLVPFDEDTIIDTCGTETSVAMIF